MKKVKITVMKAARYDDLIEKYENPIPHPCDINPGQVFFFDGKQKPEGLCESAFETLAPFALSLLRGEGNFFDGWMKDANSAMLSCNDGFRPVTFYLELVD